MTSCGNRATRTAVALLASVPGILPSGRAGPNAAEEATRGDGPEALPTDAGYVDLRRQLNEMSSDLLDERERRISLQFEANGAVLVVLGIVIGVGGLWLCAMFRSIATEASIGAASARRSVHAPPCLLPGSARIQEPSDEARQAFPRLVSAGLEADPGTRASAKGSFRGSSRTPPRLQVFCYTLSPDDLHRLEEAIADYYPAVRLDPASASVGG